MGDDLIESILNESEVLKDFIDQANIDEEKANNLKSKQRKTIFSIGPPCERSVGMVSAL